MSDPAESEPRWETWRRAEAAWAAPEQLDRAVESLSPREGRLLRAMAVLEKGGRVEVGRFTLEMLEAGEKDLVCILRLCLLSPDEIDPSEVRRRAKDLGIPNGPGLPTLDLIRLFAVAMSGTKPTRPSSLARAAATRPVLDSVLPLLSRKFTLYEFKPQLLPRSPRLAVLWTAAAAQAAGVADVRAQVRKEIPDAGTPFPEKEWPDLNRPLVQDPVSAWLATSPPPPWGQPLDQYVELVLAQAPRPVRRRVLGRLLLRINEILREGHPRNALGPVLATLVLAESLDPGNRPNPLLSQIAHVGERLEWFSGDRVRPSDIAAVLWHHLRDASPAERASFATSLVKGTDLGQTLPQPMRGEVLAEHLVSEAAAEADPLPVLFATATDIPRKTLERAAERLGGGPVVEHLLGIHEFARGDAPAALYRAANLLGHPDGAETADLLALRVLRIGVDPRQRPSRRLRRAVERWLDSLEDATPSIELAAFLPFVILQILGTDALPSRLRRLAPAVHRALERPCLPGDPRVCDEIYLLALTGEEDRGRERLREIGRHLRRHRDESGTWQHAVDLAGRFNESPPPRLPLAQQALDAVSAFLLHRGPDELLPHFHRFWSSHREEAAPRLAAWVQEHRDALGGDPEWDEWADYDPDDELEDWFDDPDLSPEEFERMLEEANDGQE